MKIGLRWLPSDGTPYEGRLELMPLCPDRGSFILFSRKITLYYAAQRNTSGPFCVNQRPSLTHFTRQSKATYSATDTKHLRSFQNHASCSSWRAVFSERGQKIRELKEIKAHCDAILIFECLKKSNKKISPNEKAMIKNPPNEEAIIKKFAK